LSEQLGGLAHRLRSRRQLRPFREEIGRKIGLDAAGAEPLAQRLNQLERALAEAAGIDGRKDQPDKAAIIPKHRLDTDRAAENGGRTIRDVGRRRPLELRDVG
jgi:hypothetical protein